MKVVVLSIVPSPYQRDLLQAWAKVSGGNLRVLYLERQSPDSPWPVVALEPWERILPGGAVGPITARFHWSWGAPELATAEVVVLNGYMSNLAQGLLRRARSDAGPRLIFWGERMRPSSGHGAKARLKRWLAAPLAKVAGVVGIGQLAAADYQQQWPALPVENIPYCCALEAFRQARASAGPVGRPRAGQPPVVLCCAQMIARKGIDVLLAAFAEVRRQGLEAQLWLIGREGELPQFLADFPAEFRGDVLYHGFRAPEALPEYFAQADLFVLPSRYDGWGVVINQALGAGLPVVTTSAVGAAYDLVEDGRNGSVVPPGEVAPLANALAHWLGDCQRLATGGAESARRVGRITPEAAAQRWQRFVHQIGQATAEGGRR